uniref:NADH dehydrogenase subunit 4 n=1 Tax=Atkinsoniella xanthoabdomena TaxID=2930063 RepID=UPI002000D73C|nr:NADH dehydrogenase subunit 4 [Atkinsoniella xanthoabdomena]UNZ12673.1 NADH dehydrogenase subunit 4 [Atkinsoniella xanthoabdomena]
MMKFIFYMLFMIPMLFMFEMWYMMQFFIILMISLFCLSNCNLYFTNISYYFGMDYISYGLIILSFLITSLMILSSSKIFYMKNKDMFMIMNLILCLCLMMVFSFLNMFMMYVFFEFSLIPLMILIFGWGYQPERLISGLYLFFYTLFASLPLLMVILFLYYNYKSVFFDMHYGFSYSFIMHFCMIFAFLVKLPMFMLHFWLPKAHVEAPISGSMILAGLMLKIGGYGLIRFMFIYENLFLKYSYMWFCFSIVGSIVVSLICLIQGDVKCLIAYSSVAHMGMSLMGILTMTKFGLYGSYLMMLGHGLCSSGLFCLANIMYERMLSRSFLLNKGLMLYMPSMCMIWFMFCSFNMSCPPSINFVSEIFILNSMIFYWNNSIYYIFMISFFAACFSFYLFSFTQHGKFHYMYSCSECSVSEYILMIIHLIPLILILMILSVYLW